MLRSFFLAIGISLVILGGECLVVDKAVLAVPIQMKSESTFPGSLINTNNKQILTPPEWAPWGLLSVGAVVSLYALTVARE